MEIRPIEAGDAPGAVALLRAHSRKRSDVPQGGRRRSARARATGCTPGAARTIAVEDGEVVGVAWRWCRCIGWSSHVGEVRLVVDPDHRGRGIGRRLARQAVLDAVDMG